jgi:hypothetical protein
VAKYIEDYRDKGSGMDEDEFNFDKIQEYLYLGTFRAANDS